MFYGIRNKIADVVSNIDLSGAKDAVTNTVDAARSMTADAVDTVTNRMKSPAEAYDEALVAVMKAAENREHVGHGVSGLVMQLRSENPYL